MTETMTLRQIAEKTEKSVRWLQMRALRESWPSCGTAVINHNVTKLYAVKDLPSDIRAFFERAEVITSSSPALPTGQAGSSPCPAPFESNSRFNIQDSKF